jgi:acetyl esterase/lipase
MATPRDPRAVLERSAPPAARTVSYGEDAAQVYDVRLPAGEPRDATVVVVHGGFWQKDFDRTHAAAQAQAFADDGFCVAVPEYRRVDMPGGGWPGTVQDVAAAVAAIRADPALPDTVVLVGHSAGGHLVAWVASQPQAHGLAGAVSLAGCVDLTLTARLGLGDRAAQTPRARCARRTPSRTRPCSPRRCRWSCCTAPTTGRSCPRCPARTSSRCAGGAAAPPRCG